MFPSRRGLLPAVRELIDFLALEFAHTAGAEREDAPELVEVPVDISAKNSSKNSCLPRRDGRK